ncbi:hypothetical protein Agabi119p4_7773 [Agaricus bisporus var. burnettii]|uniref:Uncharacterized protein n=1 Tax=Agaricus bisporus var. burnettii TaxID=192524 RepID=A0A8H7EZU2_AGABI|nr:hypothetical protein Agabi119p4_7773 [Agaricus bisporus var. burnettii]
MEPPTLPDLAMVALNDAKKSKYEAPWYGFYGLVLSPLNCSETATDVTLVYPQFPLRFQESVEVEVDIDQAEEDMEREDEPESPIYIPGAKKQRKTLQVIPGRYSTPVHQNIPRVVVTAKEYKKLRSERTPDFCRRRYYLDEEGNKFAARLDLLVEIKKVHIRFHEAKSRILRQMKAQATHAFAEDPRLSKIICMGAIGPRWFYFLEKRPPSIHDLMQRLGHPEGDSPYVPSDRGSIPITPIPKPRKRSKRKTIILTSSSDESTSPDIPERDSDALPDIVKHGNFPTMLDEGTFNDPNSAKERKWIINLKKKLDDVDVKIAKAYRKQEDDESDNELGEEEEELDDEEKDGESGDGLRKEDGEKVDGFREEDDESDDESRDEIDFLSKQTSGEKQRGGGRKEKDNDDSDNDDSDDDKSDDNESEDELDYWGKR